MALRLATLRNLSSSRTIFTLAARRAEDFHGLKGTAYNKRELAEEATYIRKHEEQLKKLKAKAKVCVVATARRILHTHAPYTYTYTHITHACMQHTHTHPSHKLHTHRLQPEIDADVAELQKLVAQATRPHVKEILNDFIAHAGSKK